MCHSSGSAFFWFWHQSKEVQGGTERFNVVVLIALNKYCLLVKGSRQKTGWNPSKNWNVECKCFVSLMFSFVFPSFYCEFFVSINRESNGFYPSLGTGGEQWKTAALALKLDRLHFQSCNFAHPSCQPPTEGTLKWRWIPLPVSQPLTKNPRGKKMCLKHKGVTGSLKRFSWEK